MSRSQRLLVVLLLNLALVAGLVIAGVTAHSLAVFAEGGDYLLDAAAIGAALLVSCKREILTCDYRSRTMAYAVDCERGGSAARS